MGHIARVCGSKLPLLEPRPPCKPTQRATHVVTKDSEDYSMYSLTGMSVKPLKMNVCVDSYKLEMEVDTGASVSIISKEIYNCLWPEQFPILSKGRSRKNLII